MSVPATPGVTILAGRRHAPRGSRFDPTPAVWSFWADETDVQFRFSLTPTAVPDGGIPMMLLGLGMLGLAPALTPVQPGDGWWKRYRRGDRILLLWWRKLTARRSFRGPTVPACRAVHHQHECGSDAFEDRDGLFTSGTAEACVLWLVAHNQPLRGLREAFKGLPSDAVVVVLKLHPQNDADYDMFNVQQVANAIEANDLYEREHPCGCD